MKNKENRVNFLSPQEALLFIKKCEKNKIAIIGIEGFIKTDQKMQPQLEMIADFSNYEETNWVDYVKECASSANKFIEFYSKVPNVFFEFVVSTKNAFFL